VELDIMFGKGVSAIGSLLDAAAKYEVIEKKGAWYNYGEEKVGQGRDNAKQFLEDNPAIAAEVEAKVRKLMFPDRTFAPTPVRAAAAAPAAPVPAAAVPAADPVPADYVAEPVPAYESAGFLAAAAAEAPVSAVPVEAAAGGKSAPVEAPSEHRGPGRPRKNPVPAGDLF
jgi:recombination protein RecA